MVDVGEDGNTEGAQKPEPQLAVVLERGEEKPGGKALVAVAYLTHSSSLEGRTCSSLFTRTPSMLLVIT